MKALTQVMQLAPAYINFNTGVQPLTDLIIPIEQALQWDPLYKTFVVRVQGLRELHVQVDSGWEFSSDAKDALEGMGDCYYQVAKPELKAILAYLQSVRNILA